MNPIVSFQKKSFDLEEELVLLKNKSHPINPSPKQLKQHQKSQTLPILADASCKTWDLSAMDIELQESSPRGAFLSERRYSIPKWRQKTHKERGNGDREGEESTLPQIRKEDPERATKILQSFLRMEGMKIETKTSQLNETPPKRTKRNKKTRHKRTPKELAPRKKKHKKILQRRI